jgi:ribosomal protein S12 methylthiotransferase
MSTRARQSSRLPPTVAWVSLGCVKALVDSEAMLGRLGEAGCIITPQLADADVIVVNTCGFLAAARDEALELLRVAAEHRRRGRCRRLVAVGCLVQRDGTKLLDAVPEVDALVGVNNREDIARAVLGVHRRPKPDLFLGDYYPRIDVDTGRLRLTPRHYAYLRLSEGCDQKCTFCTIPSIRGPMHGKPPQQILDEARELIADGAVELNLIAQDSTSYGRDIGHEPGLAGLLPQLDHLDGVEWIRLMYAYPTTLSDEIIDAVAECEHVVKYIDLPLQHVNDRVLRAMHRRIDRAGTEVLLQRVRQRIPGVSVRSTFIVGFPGETDAEFDELVQFVRSSLFEAVGVFTFCQEPGTPAARMHDQIPEDVKRQRREALMLAQQDVAFAIADARRGQRLQVLLEGRREDGREFARHAGQAPEVDSVTLLEAPAGAPGALATVEVIGRQDYDLLARPLASTLPIAGAASSAS